MTYSNHFARGIEAVFEERTNGDFVIHLRLDTNRFGRALKSMTDQEWEQVLELTAKGMEAGFRKVKDARYPLSSPKELLFGREGDNLGRD